MKQHVRKSLLQGALLVLIILAALHLGDLARENNALQTAVAQYGYPGMFVVAFVSGFNLVVPIPAVAFIPLFLESGLQFLPIVLIIALGMTLADMIAFAAGKAGRIVVVGSFEDKVSKKLGDGAERGNLAPFVALFFFAAFAPIPNELLLIPFGFLGYRINYIFPIVFAGNIVFNALYATGIMQLAEII